MAARGVYGGYEEPGSGTDEDDMRADSSEDNSKTDFEIRARRPCCCCCTAERFYHIVYVLLFMAYLVVFPLWAKWLMCAPMPYNFWHEELDRWPLLPREKTNLALSQDPGIGVSRVPEDPQACNYSCGESYLGFRTNLMNFEVALTLNKSGLEQADISTMYPVLLASEDFDNWILVGDRRHAYPEPFFRSRSSSTGQVYVHKTDQCMSMPAKNETFTSAGTYIVGCITWRFEAQAALEKLKTVTKEDLSMYCDSVGGVCGWPCGSRIPSSRLEGCNADGVINKPEFAKHVPNANFGAKVDVFACSKPEPELTDTCTLSTKPMSAWPCHTCQQQQDPQDADSEGEGGGDEDGGDAEDGDDAGGDDFNFFNRRLRSRRLQGDDDEVIVNKRFVSLPQMEVRVYDSQVPPGTDIFNTPRAFVFAAHSLEGPWSPLYSDTDIKNVPVDTEIPEKQIQRGGALNSMRLEHMNSLTIRSESCFGKRGPLYIVACAVNQSIYDDDDLWYPQKPRFNLGQEVVGPPFNDRCIAVGGRCGTACTPNAPKNMNYCTPSGEIKMEYLVGEIQMQYNQTREVEAFITVLLLGFAMKVVMLCPGIFSPYKRAHDYDPEMTEAFRYIVVVSPMATSDDNKGTMLRNIVGTVSGMPPDCRCRYHVVVNDEGHRNEMRICWQLFCRIIEAVPNYGGDSYERNVLEFTKVWCSETRILGLPQIGHTVTSLEEKILDRLSGKTALRKLLKESRWRNWEKAHLAALETAMETLREDLKADYNKWTHAVPYLDTIQDWEPKDTSSLPLRMHYTSRAKPVEDTRNLMVQHVAVGSWYYKVPKGATTEDWLSLRTRPKEMVYAMPDKDDDIINVPLRSSHGKAGGLNFVDNYMTVVARRSQNIYNDDRDEAPSLYAVAEGQHQFQPDFMLSCIPCFFRENGELDVRVSFTQAPQHYPELSEKTDYMDVNNAQFFRLTSMIRNCCGGVSSCGTNGMWMVPAREEDNIWERRRKRVRDQDKKRREHLIERELFHTGCKIEDTATTLDQVLVGRHSHFVNRKLSFGMAKDPTEFIGAQQRWVEGAVTLALQWFSNNSESRNRAKRNQWMLWAVVFMFVLFVLGMIRLVTLNNDTDVVVEYGMVTEESFDSWVNPIKEIFWNHLENTPQFLSLFGVSLDRNVLKSLFEQFFVWTFATVCAFFLLFFATMFAKVFTRCCRCSFPNEMRWWARLIISMDNLTYFVWFWTSFWWIGFNFYLALFQVNFHFNNLGMMTFMLVVNLVNFGLLMCNSMRYTVMESVDANEVAALSMDTVWRSNQLFFMTGPLQLFSVIRGISEFIKYKFYGQDIGGWTDEGLGATSVRIVKYWTTFMLLGDVIVWTAYFVYAKYYPNTFAACVTVTLISLDMLHPCVFLWFGNVNLNPHELNKMTVFQCFTSMKWWQATIKSIVLESAFASFLKYLPLVYFLFLPFLALWNSFFGLTGAYILVAMGPAH